MGSGVMAIKGYSPFPNALGLGLHDQILFCVVPKTDVEGES